MNKIASPLAGGGGGGGGDRREKRAKSGLQAAGGERQKTGDAAGPAESPP